MESIESMLAQGYSKQIVYEELKGQKLITMAYVTFAKFIAKAAKNELHVESLRPAAKPASPPASKPPASAPSQPKVIKAASDALQDPRTVDPSTLF